MFVSNIRENGQFTFSSQLLASHMSVLCISSNHGVSSHITIFVYIYECIFIHGLFVEVYMDQPPFD